ncbi:hypothetical protein ACQKFM_28740 [Paenibacillus xylanexedens]|uniref:hypothetical protein n=1 Tax=Paenibacillus xylanexedens TaxID=528191 RepID=UPI003D03D810
MIQESIDDIFSWQVDSAVTFQKEKPIPSKTNESTIRKMAKLERQNDLENACVPQDIPDVK